MALAAVGFLWCYIRVVRDQRRLFMSEACSSNLPPHALKVALLRPQIPQNTGNIARTCLLSGCALHLVRPLGFALDEKRLKRSGLDYWPKLSPTVHAGEAAFREATGHGTCWLFDSTGKTSLFDADIGPDDWLVFGSESHGIGEDWLLASPGRAVSIPQAPGGRCLNLATSVGIAIYTVLAKFHRRQHPPGHASGPRVG